jgi:L-asparaginase
MHITILTTGGTIDKVYFDAKSDYEVGDPLIGEILQEANVNFDFDVHTLFQKDSLDLTDADRFVIVEAVRECADQHIVITHGTDTMVDTARAIEEAETGKTVVLVGALNPARFRSSDAIFNIGFAMAAVQARGPGVYIAMNGQVFSPGSVCKNRAANQFETTQSAGSE